MHFIPPPKLQSTTDEELLVDVVTLTPGPQFMHRPQLSLSSCSSSSSSMQLSPQHNGMTTSSVDHENGKHNYCQRCLNHGLYYPRKGHKTKCNYARCKCKHCIMIEQRRQLNLKLRKLNPAGEIKRSAQGVRVRDPKCARCSAHGVVQQLRGHKRLKCPFWRCICSRCKFVEERRALMASQIKLRRTQQKKKSQNGGCIGQCDEGSAVEQVAQLESTPVMHLSPLPQPKPVPVHPSLLPMGIPPSTQFAHNCINFLDDMSQCNDKASIGSFPSAFLNLQQPHQHPLQFGQLPKTTAIPLPIMPQISPPPINYFNSTLTAALISTATSPGNFPISYPPSPSSTSSSMVLPNSSSGLLDVLRYNSPQLGSETKGSPFPGTDAKIDIPAQNLMSLINSTAFYDQLLWQLNSSCSVDKAAMKKMDIATAPLNQLQQLLQQQLHQAIVAAIFNAPLQ